MTKKSKGMADLLLHHRGFLLKMRHDELRYRVTRGGKARTTVAFDKINSELDRINQIIGNQGVSA